MISHSMTPPTAKASTLRVAVFTAATEEGTAKSLARGFQVAKWCACAAQKLAKKNA